MRFISIEFLVFFPVVSILFFLIPHRYRWLFLLSASYLFYMSWRPKYIVVLLAVTGIGYLAGLWLGRERKPVTRRLVLYAGLVSSLGVLLLFKLFSSLQETVDPSGIVSWMPDNILLPLGISFFTLQTASYIVDVYRGTIEPEKHAGRYALFISFFPHLTAGPIARANQLLPQFHRSQSLDYERIVGGLQRIVWGFFKKLVIADRLAVLVDTVYGDPTSYTGLALILATYAFALQIYCDFSGYADIAIGAAGVMGFNLQENFRQPYYSRSIPEFWRRWHITLYCWLRDYVFYPINRALHRSGIHSHHILMILLPPMAAMLASGLWHGTGLTFIIWGALHGLYLIGSVLLSRSAGSLRLPFSLPVPVVNGIKIIVTFNLVSFAWIFFRAGTLPDAFYIIRHLFVGLDIRSSLFGIVPGGWYEWMVALLAILLMEVVHWVQERNGSLRTAIRRQPVWLRWSVYYGLVIAIFMFGKFGAGEFIYSRF